MTHFKLRIKHPSGAEFEAEGPAELILSEKAAFLGSLPRHQSRQPEAQAAPEQDIWTAITAIKNGNITLKTKHPAIQAATAALILLAAAKYLNNSPETAAIALSKALKASGYAPGRLDRLLAKANREGLVKASGTKRNRAYQATDRGAERAWLEARKLNT